MDEKWKSIPGWEGMYEVSDRGRVRTVARVVQRRRRGPLVIKERIRATHPMPRTGHHHVVLMNRQKNMKRSALVHQLVAEAFIGERPEGMQVRHIDGDPTNNRVANLVWGTGSENASDSVRHGTHVQTRKTHCPQGHEYTESNTYLHRRKRYCRTCKRIKSAERRRRSQTMT